MGVWACGLPDGEPAVTFGKCVALALSLMILGQAYLVRRYVGTWLFPACLFGLFWFGFTFFPLAILFWVPVNPWATGFLFVCSVAFSMGSLAFDWKAAFAKNAVEGETAIYGSKFLNGAFYVFTLSALLFLILNLFVQGFSLRDFFFDLYASADAYANLVVAEDFKTNIFDQWSLIFTYLGAILGGLLFSCSPSKGRRWLIVVLSFLPPTVVALTQTVKGHLFLCLVFFYAGMLIHRISTGKLYLFERRHIRLLAGCGVVLIVIASVAFVSRGMQKVEDTEDLRELLLPHFASYSCAHLYAFSDWFAFANGMRSQLIYPHESAGYGFYTFMAPFQWLGNHRVAPSGIFDQYFFYGDLLTGNIYTMFRGLIQDFGMIGGVGFMVVAGFLLHWNFYRMLGDKWPAFTVAAFVFMLGYFYTSFVISLLIWNRIYVAFALLWVVLQINKRITQTEGRRLAMTMETAAQ